MYNNYMNNYYNSYTDSNTFTPAIESNRYDEIYNRQTTDKISLFQLNNLIRKLWEEHITWTRFTVMSIASNSPDTTFVTNRLLRNATDFGELFAHFYGPQIGQEFASLIHDHLTIAADLVVAAKKGDNNAITMIEKKWFKNADDIASFLNRINPNWNRSEMQRMMYDHLNLLKTEVIAILNNKYAESISIFDDVENQILMMADAYTEGFVRQFPNKIED